MIPLLLAAASLLILSAAPAQYLGRQDDLLYLLASRALCEGSYRLITSPGTPPMTLVTPGFPALLLPVTWFAGDNFSRHQAFCALILAACPWGIWLWLKDKLDGWERVLVPLAFASSPLILSQAGTVMTEPTALLLALGAAILAARPGPRLGLILSLAVMVRPASLALLAGATAASWRRRSWPSAAWTVLPPLAAWSAWCFWSWAASGSLEEARELSLTYGAGLSLFRNALENGRYYLSSWGSTLLPARWGEGPASLAAGCLLLAAAARGARKRLKEKPDDPAVWMLAGLLALHAAWPWRYERYLVPLLPWLLWLCARGLGRLARPALAALVLAQCAFHVPAWAFGRTAWSRPELAETYEWIRGKTLASEALASPTFVRDGFYAARPSQPLPRAVSAQELAERLATRRTRWVLWQEGLETGADAPQASLARLGRLLAESPQLFRLAYANERERSAVYEVR